MKFGVDKTLRKPWTVIFRHIVYMLVLVFRTSPSGSTAQARFDHITAYIVSTYARIIRQSTNFLRMQAHTLRCTLFIVGTIK